ncbi:MAG: tetratricopeptide repeat-containing protein, partial [Desulfobacterales bacterium]|nr:tetratricopeptide repeat-containing protein [Desulfobacterales bacterium]
MVAAIISSLVFSTYVTAQEAKTVSDRGTTAKALNDKGKALINSGKAGEALDAFIKANELAPRAVEYASNAGVAAFMVKNYTLSAQYFQKVVDIGLALKNYPLISQYQAQVKSVLGSWPQEKMNRVEQLKQAPSDGKGSAAFPKWQNTITKAAGLLGAGKLEGARVFTDQAIKLAEENFEPGHMLTLESKKQLARILASQNQHQKAVNIYDAVQKGYRSHLGQDHPETVWINFEKALITKKMGLYDTALDLLENTINSLAGEVGDHHIKLIRAQYEKAVLLKEKGDTTNAEKQLKQVLEDYSRTLKEHHPDTIAVFSALAKVYEAQTRYTEAAQTYKKIEELQAEA